MSTSSYNSQLISIALIDPPAWNSRLPKTGAQGKGEAKKIEALAESFKTDGQLTPIEVQPKEGGRFELVYGTRRLAAAKLNQWDTIRANVNTGAAPADLIYRNIVENAQRENLTPFELARASAQLRDLGLKNNEIGPKLGLSPSHVSNLNTAYSTLPKPVLEDWEKENPAASIQTLCAIAREGKDDEDKVRRWDAVVAEAAKREAAGEKVGKRGKAGKGKGEGGGAGFPVSQKRLGHIIHALSSKSGSPDLTEETRRWGKAICDYIVKGRETPPAGVPKMPTKADKGKDGDK